MHENAGGDAIRRKIKKERLRSRFTVELMEMRGGQEREIGMPSSLVYNPPIRDSSSQLLSSPSIISISTSTGSGARGGEAKRKDGTGNGTTILNPSQTFDHHHHQHQPHRQVRDPSPDPTPVAIAVTSATGAGGSNSTTTAAAKTTPPPLTATNASRVTCRYRECLKNHAASIGGHVIDGCGEFMPSSEEGTPEALKCAACDCHRNFHRKEIDGEPQSCTNSYYYYNPNDKTNNNNSSRSRIPHLQLPSPLPPPPFQQHQKFPLGLPTSPSPGSIPHMMMAFGGGGGGATESSSEDLNVFQSNAGGARPPAPPFILSKKRFRTKFTHEQKEKMLEFAEKVGWRFQKQDEPAVQQFCGEVGVKRQVLKVWMHNNKHSLKKKQL